MSCFERMEDLRSLNKQLLEKLQLKTNEISSLTLEQRKAVGNARGSVSLETVTRGRRSLEHKQQPKRGSLTHRAAQHRATAAGTGPSHLQVTAAGRDSSLCIPHKAVPKAKVTFTDLKETDNFCESNNPLKESTCNHLLQDQTHSQNRELHTAGQMQTEPTLLSQDRDRNASGHISLTSPEHERGRISESVNRVPPLLGYDWIAGLLDAENSLTERSDQFFSELRTFRQFNKEECVHRQSPGQPADVDLWTSVLEDDVIEQEHTPDTHRCTFSYRVNSRLFATPVSVNAACAICRMPKAKHPHTNKEPAFIRVSIPRSTLMPAYQYKAHRRCSFDPSDSLSLPSHCLSGWPNLTPSAGAQVTNLDLRSSVKLRPDSHREPSTQNEMLQYTKSCVAGSQLPDKLLNVSRLARYHFQHHGSTKSKPDGNTYPVY